MTVKANIAPTYQTPAQGLKITSQSLVKSDTAQGADVNLSYTPNLSVLPCNYTEIKRYTWNETSMRCVPKLGNLRADGTRPPIQSGERSSNGITRRGKSVIRKAAKYYQHLAEQKGTKAYASFITLTYGKYVPTDKEAKKHLSAFLKRMDRSMDGKFDHYTWVAERQKRGAIHFHILTPHFIDYSTIQTAWNGIVVKAQREAGAPYQKVYTNVVAVYNASAYMTKYMSKEGQNIVGNGYFASHATHDAIKPTFHQTLVLTESDSIRAHNMMVQVRTPEAKQLVADTFDYRALTWLSDTNDYRFREWLNEVQSMAIPELLPSLPEAIL